MHGGRASIPGPLWVVNAQHQQMAQTAVAVLLGSASLALSSLSDGGADGCLTESVVRASWHVLVCACLYTIYHLGVRLGSSIASRWESSEPSHKGGEESIPSFVVEDDLVEDEELAQEQACEGPAGAKEGHGGGGLSEIADTVTCGVTCITAVTLLQFHSPLCSTAWSMFLLVFGFPHVVDSPCMLTAVFVSFQSALIFLLGSSEAMWPPTLESSVKVLLPLSASMALSTAYGSRRPAEVLVVGAPVSGLVSLFVVLLAIGSDSPCSIDVVSEWREGGHASTNTTLWDNADGGPVLLAAPLLSLASLLVVLHGAACNRTSETGVSVLLAACIKAVCTPVGSRLRPTTAVLCLVFSCVSTALVCLHRALRSGSRARG